MPKEESQRAPLHIRASSGWVPLKLGELWEYNELLYFLAWRDLKVRYKQTVLGVAWVILQPVLMTLVFTILFDRWGGGSADTQALPYPVFVFCALLPWQFFAYVLANSGNSLVASERLITKIYFPRLIIPLSGAVSGLVDLAVGFVLLLVLMGIYGISPRAGILLFPLVLAMAIACSVGMGLWLAALNLRYRDVRHTMPFLTQVWFFLTPVVYPLNWVPQHWLWLYALNPMVGVVEGFRWTLLGGAGDVGQWAWGSAMVTAFVLTSGLYYFRRMEKNFADVI